MGTEIRMMETTVRRKLAGQSGRATCRIFSAARALLAETDVPDQALAGADGVVRVQLKPEVTLRRRDDGCVELRRPRDPAGRTLQEALDAGWCRVMEPRLRGRRDRPLSTEQVDALHRLFYRLRPGGADRD